MPQHIPLSWAMLRCSGAIALGARADDLLSASLIRPEFGDDRDGISSAQMGLLCLHTYTSIDDEACGFARKPVRHGRTTLAMRIMLGCATLECALRAVIQFYDAAGPVKLALRMAGGHACLAVHCDDGVAGVNAPFVEEIYLNALFGAVSHFLGYHLPVTLLETRIPQLGRLSGPHWTTKAPVRHGALTALHFARPALRLPCGAKPSDEIVWDVFRPWLDFVGHSLHQDAERKLAHASVRVRELAAQAGIGMSTYRRVMRRSEGGFRASRERQLTELGVELLATTALTVEAIAELVGYSEARSFRRFIKRVTGSTPEQLRQTPSAGVAAGHPPELAVIRQRIQQIALRM